MNTFWKYLGGVLFGIGLGIIGTYYFGISGQYVPKSTLLTLLSSVISLNFMILGIIVGYWRYRKEKRP